MNKAFIREPEFDGKAYCPRCGSLGVAVSRSVLDHYIVEAMRSRLADSAWYCDFAKCEVAYFDLLEQFVTTHDLIFPVYPKDSDEPVCACFGFRVEDVEADVEDGIPSRIRELLLKSKSSDARCGILAANGKCCIPEIQRLFMKGRSAMS
jgi:hypothetical protein